jgi:hypothetical protein
MTLLTIFSAPKPFTDPHIAVIQRNAIRSWTLLPDAEVFLIGDEAGLAETAAELGVRHFPDVSRNSEGTPLLSHIFGTAHDNSTSPLLAYVNADILLMPDFVEAARQVADQKEEFLMVGQRWDVGIDDPLDFSGDWVGRLRQVTRQRGRLHRPSGSDYFIFRRDSFAQLPDFAVGRAGWDNWMIYKARREHWAAIDASADIMIVHQNHDYSHLPGGQRHHRLPESKENVRMGGGQRMRKFRLYETSHRLVDGRVSRQPLSVERLRNEFYVGPYLYISSDSLRGRIARVLKALRLSQRHKIPRPGHAVVEH